MNNLVRIGEAARRLDVSSITLRRAERSEDTLLRNQVEEIQATAKSLMPENLETQLSKQETADLIAYLLAVAAPK